MNTTENTTTHRYETRLQVAIVLEKLEALTTRAAKKGLIGTLDTSVERIEISNEGKTVERFEMTLTHTGDFALGEYKPVGVIDFSGASSGLVFSIGDADLGDIDLDPLRCDHCERKVRRNKVIVVESTDGERLHVGGTCVKDFLGHDPQWFTWVYEATMIDDEESVRGSRFDGRFDFESFMLAAIEANRLGYRPTSFADSTKSLTITIVYGELGDKNNTADREALEAAAAATITVADVKRWMLALDGDSDFDRNMRAIAKSEFIGPKAYGTAAYAPAGLLRWNEKEAARKAKAAAEAERLVDASPAPVSDKRIRIEGVITTRRTERNDFGTVEKIRIETSAGWACWGTLPAQVTGDWDDEGNFTPGADVSDTISFDARLAVSDDDEFFGFFSRPTKGVIVERGEVVEAPAPVIDVERIDRLEAAAKRALQMMQTAHAEAMTHVEGDKFFKSAIKAAGRHAAKMIEINDEIISLRAVSA